MEVNSRRPTLQDVADLAGVSRALVSIVIRDVPGASDATRVRVKAAADELGYRPDNAARLLRQHRSRLIGVSYVAAQTFHAELLDEIYVAAERSRYDVVLSAVSERRPDSRATRTLLDDRCEAILLLGSQAPEAEIVDLADKVPVVVIARKLSSVHVDVVRTDDEAGAVMAVNHLVELGHRSIAHVDGGRGPGAQERRQGYRKAMRAAGLEPRILPGGLTEEFGAAAARSMVEGGLPGAVFAFNDRCALGVLDVFLRAGISVPGDVSVIGFDNSALAGLAHIDLTSVGQDTAFLGGAAVERISERLDGGSGPLGKDIVAQPQLVVRGSTGPAGY